jgi:serine/threonine-protein kinase HipA
VKKIKQLRVATPQGEAGDLHKQARFVFNYTTTERSGEISLTMPLRAESYVRTSRQSRHGSTSSGL